jgi:hypothetical protein
MADCSDLIGKKQRNASQQNNAMIWKMQKVIDQTHNVKLRYSMASMKSAMWEQPTRMEKIVKEREV